MLGQHTHNYNTEYNHRLITQPQQQQHHMTVWVIHSPT